MAVNRNFARTPGRRVSQTPDSHASPICQLPGPPGIPPPAALTSVICNGFLLRLFSASPLRHLPSFLFFMESSPLVVCNFPPHCPLLDPSIPLPPHLPETGAAEPAVFGGRRKRRKFPGRKSPEPKNRGKWGSCEPVSAPKYQMGRNVIAFEDLSTFGPHCFWTWR